MPMENDIQFLARMIVATREQQQVASGDARRLNNIATFGDSLDRSVESAEAVGSTTMPEERRSIPPFPDPAGVNDVVRG